MRVKRESDLWHSLTGESLTLDDVAALFRDTAQRETDPERIAYANSLVPEAGHYLRAYELRALLRAEISESEAAIHSSRNKSFFTRLAELLPSLLGFFELRENLAGLLYFVDECHNDYHHVITSPRRDRQARQTKELLGAAREATAAAAAALERVNRLAENQYAQYSAAYYGDQLTPRHERPQFERLIEELIMCSGVLEVIGTLVDLSPPGDSFTGLHLGGNDPRTLVVESAYHMCVDWGGPQLVTTPGSQFAAFCSLLFEAVSGTPDESLSGAINRYARSDDRRQWDVEGDELENETDNFLNEKQKMKGCLRQIEICKALKKSPGLSALAETLLQSRIDWEHRNYQRAYETYGPRQVYVEDYNREQLNELIAPIVHLLDSQTLETLRDKTPTADDISAIALEALSRSDISVGKAKRSGRPEVDA